MSVTTTDHNLVNEVLQPLTNGDDVADLDVRHEVRDASTSSKENSEVKSALLSAKDSLTDDIVAKATVTDSAAEALLLHLEANGDLETISTTPSEESREEAQLISILNGASNEHTILPAVDAKAESTQDTLIEPSIEAAPSVAKEPIEDPSVKHADAESTIIESESAVSSSVNNDSTVTGSDDTGLPVPSAPSLEDATEANKDAGIIPSVPSTINVIDTHPEQTAAKAEDSAHVSASALLSEDAPATAEVPAPITEAAIVPSSNKLEENVSIPEPEPSKAAAHDEATTPSDATPTVPTSIAEPQDAIPSQVAAEKGSPTKETVILDTKQAEPATPITNETLPSEPIPVVETVSTSVDDASIPTVHEPEAPASGEVPATKVEEVLVEQEIEKALAEAEDDVEQAPRVAVAEESVAASTPVSTDEVPAIEAQGAIAEVDDAAVEEAHVKQAPVEVAIVKEVQVEVAEATALEKALASTEAPAVEAEDAVVAGDAPVVDKVPVVEETSVVEEAPAAEETPVVEEAPALEVQALPAVVEEAPVVEAELLTIQAEAPVTEKTPAVQAESPVAKEVPAVEEASAVKVEVPAAEDFKAEAPVPVAEHAVPEVATPAPAQEVESDKAEATEIPVTEAPSVAQPEPVVEEKPVEAEVSLVETSVTPSVEDKVPKEDPPAEVEEVISQAEEEAAVAGDVEKPSAEELKGGPSAVAVDEPSATKEETASRETVKEDVEDVAEVKVLAKEQPEAVEEAIVEAEKDAVVNSPAEHAEEKGAEHTEEVVHVKHEPESSVDNKATDDDATPASEPIQEVVPAVEIEESQEETAPESVVRADKPEPSAEVEVPAPAEEPITASGVSQEDVKHVEDSEPAVVVTLEEPASEELHLDLQPPTVESITIEGPTPAAAGDPVGFSGEEAAVQETTSITPLDTDDAVASQAPLVEDTVPTASTEVVVETPNPIIAEEPAAVSAPSEPVIEAAPIETPILIAETPADNKSDDKLEEAPLKVQQEESYIEPEIPQAQVEAEALEASNPSADEAPTVVEQPNEIAVDAEPSSRKRDEEALAIEAAIEEAEMIPIDDTPVVPLPIDEIAEEIPEAVQQPVAEESALEVHATAEPSVLAPTEDEAISEGPVQEVHVEKVEDDETTDKAPIPDTTIALERTLSEDYLDEQIALEEASAAEDATLSAPFEEASTLDDPPVQAQSNTEEVVPAISPEATVQESTENNASVAAPEEPLSVEASSIPEEVAETPVEGQRISVDTEAGVEEQPAAQHDIVRNVEKQIDTITEPVVLKEASVAVATAKEESTPEGKPAEDSVESEQADIVQEQLSVEEVPVTGEAVPEQTSADREVHLALAEADTVLPALNEEAETPEETIIMTSTSLGATENELAAADVPEAPSAAKAVESELEFNNVEGEGQLHAEETKPAEKLASANDDLLSPAPGAEIERPKSPWTPSFQVTTVGRGVSSPDEDEEVETSELELVKDAPVVEAPVDENAVTETALEVPQVATPPTEEKGEVSESSVVPSGVETPQLLVDTSSLDTPPAEIARPWTPSYSVHSQGSPLHGATDLEQEASTIAPVEAAQEQVEYEPELAEMEFANNEEVPVAAIPTKSEEQIEEPVEAIEQRDFVATEIPAEESLLSEASASVVDDTSVDEATSAVPPAAIEDMRVHMKDLQVEAEQSTPAEEDAQGLESALDAVEEDAAVAHAEVAEVEESAPTEEVAQVPQLVLDTSEEVTELHNPHESETDSSHLTPQQYEQAQERPASPSWVASYSVSTQGSPLQEHAPLVEEHAPSPDAVPATAEAHPEVTVQHDPPRESSEAPAGETISEPQAPAKATTAEDILAKDVEDETPVEEEVVHTKPQNFIVLVNDAEANTQEDIPPDTSLTLVDDAINVQDPPKSPWTPSYSVTIQGPGTPGEEKELDNIELLPQRALDIGPAKNAHDDLKAETEVITPAVVEKTSPANAPVVAIAEESKLPPVMALERELQELQASINLDGGDVTPVVNVAVVDAAQQEYFPTVETTEKESKLSKLSVSRLAPVNEVEGLETGPSTSETVSSPSTRSRLESTTSSRFFPGGWFSTASKVVDEGRTSLEIAQGEFIPSKVTSPISPAEDIFDTPDDASATSTASGQATDSEEEDEEEPEHKRRWCVVM